MKDRRMQDKQLKDKKINDQHEDTESRQEEPMNPNEAMNSERPVNSETRATRKIEPARGEELRAWQEEERGRRLLPLIALMRAIENQLRAAHPDWEIQAQMHLDYLSLEIAAWTGANPVLLECRRTEEVRWRDAGALTLFLFWWPGECETRLTGTPERFQRELRGEQLFSSMKMRSWETASGGAEAGPVSEDGDWLRLEFLCPEDENADTDGEARRFWKDCTGSIAALLLSLSSSDDAGSDAAWRNLLEWFLDDLAGAVLFAELCRFPAESKTSADAELEASADAASAKAIDAQNVSLPAL